MDSNKSKVREEVLNVVNDKRYVAGTKEKLVSHFSSLYKKKMFFNSWIKT